MATTNWKPDTHDIEFIFTDGVVSFVSNNPKYVGRDPQEVFDEVRAENAKINESGLKDQLDNGEVTLESILE